MRTTTKDVEKRAAAVMYAAKALAAAQNHANQYRISESMQSQQRALRRILKAFPELTADSGAEYLALTVAECVGQRASDGRMIVSGRNALPFDDADGEPWTVNPRTGTTEPAPE